MSKVLSGNVFNGPGAGIGIGNLKSKKFLQAVSTRNGARVVLQEGNQINLLQNSAPVSDRPYISFWIVATGSNLGIDGASTAPGAAAIIATGSGDLNQDWLPVRVKRYPDGYFAMKNRKSGLCLGISDASTVNGAQAAQFPCDNLENQGWALFNP
ncbi:RICIN domain-containing protein [Streptomyces canus]|uniref:RICIN domain-containing protein n=1 Tax=Streptomyces canus TaxID=58343 RepID=UPI0030E02515